MESTSVGTGLVKKGVVKWFNKVKGYGFITVGTETDGEKNNDMFVHYSDIMDGTNKFKNLAEGDEVEFEMGSSEKGSKAINVKVTKKAVGGGNRK